MELKRIICCAAAAVMIGTAVPADSSVPLPSLSYSVSAASKLSAPTGAKAVVSGSKVTLSWNKVSGADGYRIYKYDSSAKKFTALKTVAGNKSVISDLPAGTHYFKIAAVTKSGKKYSAGTATDKIKAVVKNGSSSAKPSSSAASSQKPAQSSSSSAAVNSSSVALAKKMGKGTNLGNTMEAVATWLGSNAKAKDYENAWGQPTTTKAMMEGLKKSGFDSVRVPVAWSNMMSKDGKYTISQDYFDRVDEIVGYVLDSDMYCIINIHWDGGWWEDFGSEDEKVRDEAMKRYKAMWKQIADHYKDHSDKLIFESANEELGSKTKGKSNMNDSYARVNTINQTFVDIVRSTGGKNKNRFLLIAGYDTDIAKTSDKRFVMPKDSADGKLLVSVHYYTPSTFCIADNPGNSWGYKDSWGTDSDIANMEKDFAKMKRFTDEGYGVIIGEYGVTKAKNGTIYTIKKGTDEFFRNVVSLSKKYGYCAMLWDCNDWYNRNKCSFNSDEYAQIYKR